MNNITLIYHITYITAKLKASLKQNYQSWNNEVQPFIHLVITDYVTIIPDTDHISVNKKIKISAHTGEL